MASSSSARTIGSLCVFCGSRTGADACYAEAARALGRALVERGMTLVYGGGQIGLMGVVADAVLEAGGRVIGVIPEPLATHELLHPRATEMHIVPGMHARKAKMVTLSDAFVALPGGYGTLEELFEVVTWAQLGIHAKPVGVLNVAGFYDPLVALVQGAVEHDFIKSKNRDLIVVHSEPAELIDRLSRHQLPAARQWIAPEQT
jgi:uncharacterized protein (TIGR00730 family)